MLFCCLNNSKSFGQNLQIPNYDQFISRSEQINELCEQGKKNMRNGNKKLAALYFEKAALCGNAYAQIAIASLYQLGEGVEMDIERAAFWWKAAANQGDLYACYKLGLLYYLGDGVEQDYEKALHYFQAVLDFKDQFATSYCSYAFSLVAVKGSNSTDQDKAEVKNCLEIAAFLGNELAIQVLNGSLK